MAIIVCVILVSIATLVAMDYIAGFILDKLHQIEARIEEIALELDIDESQGG